MVGDAGIQHYTKEVSLCYLSAEISLTMTLFQDDWYDGFFIPKGTICLANIWYDSESAFGIPRNMIIHLGA